ncbi:MAG: NuoM family protein [Verrucomicrobiota bacterium]
MSPLSWLILTPFLTAAFLLLIPGNFRFVIRCLALLGTLVTAGLGVRLFFQFQPGGAEYQFEHLVPWVSTGGVRLGYHVALDGISVGLVLVAALVGFAATAVSWDIDRHVKLFYVLLLMIIGGAVGAFASLDLFFFYFFNELALVPTFIMIGVWGSGEDRTEAAYRITLYLTLGALVALAGLIGLYVASGANSLDVVELRQQFARAPLSPAAQAWIFPCLLFGFGTLVGLWPFHSWAPSGYASAPTATAMLHAGILKKAGLLALLRVAWPFMPEGVARWMPVLAVLCLGNLLYCGWVAMRQRDLNLLIGNSSLAHMGFAFLGLASANVIGITGTVLVMVSHALLAGLSFAVTGWLRRQTGTLDMDRLGGLLKAMPFVGSVLMIALLAGCGVPGFAGFAGELTVMFGAWKAMPGYVVAAAWGGLVIGGVYMLRAIRQVLHGEGREEWADVWDASGLWRKLPYALLVAGLVFFGVFPGVLSERIKPAAAAVAGQAARTTAPAPAHP